MDDHGEVELWLDRQDGGTVTVQLRLRPPGSQADHVVGPATVELPFDELRQEGLDPIAYGELLNGVFADAAVGRAFDEARVVCEGAEAALRIRLFIGPGATDLHDLRWECLADRRAAGGSLLTHEQIHFSRYLNSYDWRPVRLRPKAELRALIAVASPSDLDRYPKLAPVDAPGILARAAESLASVPFEALAGPGEATLDNLVDKLAEGFDILYLVAHGALVRGEPYLWLVTPEGVTDRVSGNELVRRVGELAAPPSLAVLASCQSAGSGDAAVSDDPRDWGALSALGPRLGRAGVPAVLAVQGRFSMETEAAFLPRFFAQLCRDGRVDRAVSVARAAVRDRPDWWMPVLYTRLRRGRIWYHAGFGEGGDAQDKWPAVIRHIQRSRGGDDPDEGAGGASARGRAQRRRRSRLREGGCTPVLGSGLLEPYVGRLQDIADYWAKHDSVRFPMEPHDREDLCRIAQFIDVKVERRWLHGEMERHLCRELARRHRTRLTPEQQETARGEEPLLAELLPPVAAARAARGVEGHHVLAELDLPLYLTVNPDGLLEELLEGQGKEPLVDICRWHEDLVHDDEPVFEPLGDDRPTPQRPLVYHLFGHVDEPRSLVLSEDDHFDFLTGFTRHKDHIPSVVRAALASTALLFVGFRLDDWSFRVLFRAVMSRQGATLATSLSHVAAQIEPEGGRLIDSEGTRSYLRKYAGAANISLYWGTAESFLGDLRRELTRVEREGV